MISPTHHARFLLGSIGAFLLAAFLLNTWVNPLRVTPAPWSASSLDDYRDISAQIRTGKAGIIRSHDRVDIAFLGSSRVENGLNPEQEPWESREVLNLGCSGGYIFESVGIGRYLLEHRSPSILICGIDPGDLTRSMDSRDKSDYYASPFSPTGDPVDREMRYLFGVSTVEQSVDTLVRATKADPSPYTPKGLRSVDVGEERGSQVRFIRSQLVGEAYGNESPRDWKIRPEKIAALRSLMVQCRTEGVRLVLFIHPQHALLTARAHHSDDPVVFFRPERAAVIDAVEAVNALDMSNPEVELWDFFDFHPINCERIVHDTNGRMRFWDDLGHFSVEVGDAMLARMLGWQVELEEASDYGIRLGSSNLEARLSQLESDYSDYLNGPGTEDVAWKEGLITKARQR